MIKLKILIHKIIQPYVQLRYVCIDKTIGNPCSITKYIKNWMNNNSSYIIRMNYEICNFSEVVFSRTHLLDVINQKMDLCIWTVREYMARHKIRYIYSN